MRGLELVPILLVAISSNQDNVAVGIAYGIRNVRVPLLSNAFIAVFTGCVTFASTLAGQRIGYYLQPQLASLVGGGIIAAIGAWVLVQSMRPPVSGSKTVARQNKQRGPMRRILSALEDPLSLDRDLSGHIDLKEVSLLAVALSLNNVGNGIGAGMVGINPAFTTIAVMFFSVIMLSAGVTAGSYGQRVLGSFARVASGVLLVVVGMYEIHL